MTVFSIAGLAWLGVAGRTIPPAHSEGFLPRVTLSFVSVPSRFTMTSTVSPGL